MAAFIDDRSPHCIPFILRQLESTATHPATPLLIGLNGIQGAGKTTLVRALATALRDQHRLNVLVVSIDDFYWPRAQQAALAEAHPDNALVQHRGEPGTHDVELLEEFLANIVAGKSTKVPQYDKSVFHGKGDRVPETEWQTVNAPDDAVQVVILEGWCVGFRPLPDDKVAAKHADSVTRKDSSVLWKHKLADLQFVNAALRGYEPVTDKLQAFIHIDAQDTHFVYGWRLEQEQMLRREKGTGMTDDEVVAFVDGYYPAYELYSDGLRRGVLRGASGSQLRLVVGRDRRVIEVFEV